MTIREVLAALRRRWYVPLAMVVCAGALFFLFARDGGIYATRTIVSFTMPSTTSLAPNNGANDYTVIAFAGSVASEVNNGRPPAGYSFNEAPYWGAGIRQGVLVSLPSAGNQWYENYNRADIEVQVVGRSLEWVEQKQDEVLASILSTSEAQQSAIAPEARIEATVVPLTTTIAHVVPSRSSQIFALGALLLAAGVVGTWASVALDRRVRRRSRRPAAARASRREMVGALS